MLRQQVDTFKYLIRLKKKNSINYRILFSFTVLYNLVYGLLRDSTYRKGNDRKRKKANTTTKWNFPT